MRALVRPFAGVHRQVLLESRVEAEAAAALGALVRALAGVRQLVALDVGAARVRLVALRALELPLADVRQPVLGALQQRVEALAAVLALVLELVAVRLAVLDELLRRLEALAANGARVRHGPLVTLLVVRRQRAQVGEVGRARLAAKDALTMGLALVLSEVPRVLEGLVAVRATEGSLARVDQLVPPHVRRARERLAAVVALVTVVGAFDRRVLGGYD